MKLGTSLNSVLKTTKDHVAALKEMNIKTVEDLLLYLPRGYEDLSEMASLDTAQLDEKSTFTGTVENIKLIRTRHGKKLVTALFTDTTGQTAEVIWFNQTHIKRMLSDGQEVVLTGKLIQNGLKLQIQSPQFETPTSKPLVHSGRLVPVYPQHDCITSKWLREKLALVRKVVQQLPENLPEEIVESEDLLPRWQAIEVLHFPESSEQVQKAQERMSFENMFAIQTEALTQKQQWQSNAQERLQTEMDVELIKALFSSLGFTPTDGQKIAIYEILKDMENPQPMSRLLEGDVGSGKTLVATAVMANTIRNGGQCALMVPTEVLARQHVQSIGGTLIRFWNYLTKEYEGSKDRSFFDKPPTIALLTGSLTAKESKETKEKLQDGSIDLIIGTHALIEDSVQFKNLLLVIVDEQHRFGVQQRQRLVEKGSPHFLAMTATPIPRTLALTAHGHHDLSVLMEKPGNRQPIHTKVVPPNDRKTVELFIDSQIEEGRQAFVICPLIKTSDNDEFAEIKSVEAEFSRLNETFSRRNIALLHGKMSAQEKESIMQAFKAKEYDILVSTSVIEVGIDVPNASIIVIEGSERFGLAQLHQFRGRVGRGEHKSHCFLFTTDKNQAYSERLKSMEKYDSGFQLAEIDLQLRGPGELFGTRQSGVPEVILSSMYQPELIVKARQAAAKYLGIKQGMGASVIT